MALDVELLGFFEEPRPPAAVSRPPPTRHESRRRNLQQQSVRGSALEEEQGQANIDRETRGRAGGAAPPHHSFPRNHRRAVPPAPAVAEHQSPSSGLEHKQQAWDARDDSTLWPIW